MREYEKENRRGKEKCPKCGKTENQVKAGYNGSGSQRCRCKECGIYYTVDPKRHAYPEETRELAIKMYYGRVSGRGGWENTGNEQIQCNKLDKKRAQKMMWKSAKASARLRS